MIIKYGIVNNNIDVTDICLTKLMKNNVIIIPSGDINRSNYFGDPVYGVLKKIFIISNNKIIEYTDELYIKIHVPTGVIQVFNDYLVVEKINSKLSNIQSTLKINHGNFNEEVPEQKMSIRYLKGNEKVLEIGGNIGRNSLVISKILNDDKKLVVLECDEDTSLQLKENRDLNNCNFNIENSALSKMRLIQKGWDTMPSEVLIDGYKWVNTIEFDELKLKYNIEFDTLVLDCEGAFYYILQDFPDILTNINLIIMENDYHDINKKNYVDDILMQNNFYRDYFEDGGWGPCKSNFFEVWRR